MTILLMGHRNFIASPKIQVLSAVLAGLCLLATGVQSQSVSGPKIPEGTRSFRNVPYVTNGHERQKLDLYLPPNATNALPLIIWVHGGAWREGSKEHCLAWPYLSQGYAVASLNYRLSQHATFPAQLQDCKAAVRWLRAHAGEYGLDSGRFAAWGASAGGHLVALLGTTGDLKKFDVGENLGESSRVQAVVDFFGPTDFTQRGEGLLHNPAIDHDSTDAPEAQLIGGAVLENRNKAAAASPITYVTKASPPFLILHGNKDNIVPYQQSELLRDALQAVGASATLVIITNAGHGFGGPAIDRQVERFLERQLKAEKPPE